MSNIIDVSEKTFEQAVIKRSHSIPVVVDFWAPWCGPCRMLGPVLEKLAREPESGFILAKVNVDENQALSWKYKVQGIPAVKAFVNGQEAAEFVGARPEPVVREFIRSLIPDETEGDFSQAMELLLEQNWPAAEASLRPIVDDNPTHADAVVSLARAVLGQARGCEAERLLKTVRTGPAFATAQQLLPLARYLCEADVSWRDDDEITLLETQYRRVALLLERGNVPAAMDGMLDVLRQNKNYKKGNAREVMIGLFALLGDQHPLTRQYRQELASLLF